MDTLVSLGTIAAYVWSVVALVFLGAGEQGMSMGAGSAARASGPHVYFETAARSSRCSSSASTSRRGPAAARATRSARSWSSGPRPPVSRTVTRSPSPVCGWATASSCGRARRSRPTARWSTARRPSTCRCSPASRCPVDVAAGDAVFGATLNTSGRLVVEATRVGDDTALAQIARLVEEAQGSKAPGAAAGRPHLGGVRAGRAGDRGGDAGGLVGCSATAPTRRSPPRSRCSSSPARARSDSPRRPRSWSAPVGARSSAS